MRISIAKLKDFIRYGHTYKKAALIAALAVLVIVGLGLAFLLPNLDAASAQAGLTIVAEILGVLLGAVLIIVVLLVEQGQQAEELLRQAYPKYRRLLESHIKEVDRGRQQLVELVTSGKIRLDDSVFVLPNGEPLSTKYRDVVGSLIGLTIALRPVTSATLERTLEELGFTEDERDEVLFGKGVVADFDPAAFLKLVGDALDPNCILHSCSDDVGDLSGEILQQYFLDGVSKAISNHERAQTFLKSKRLATTITLVTATTVGSVMTLFGTTDKTIAYPAFIWVIVSIVAGFMLSVLSSLLLMEKVLT